VNNRLSLKSSALVGSMLFGLFFGAGNLIFPVHMGQAAGSNVLLATIGFLITGVGLPFLGIIAMGISNSTGLFDLSSRVHPVYAYVLTILLYLTIGPLFALPRTGTVPYEIGVAPFMGETNQALGLAVFTFLFFLVALIFALRPSKILVWVGKILNPLFLVFLAVLVVVGFLNPMGGISNTAVTEAYSSAALFKGFTEGYNTMDALASLAFGIIVINAIKDLGVKNPKDIAIGTVKSGFVSMILMGVIYACLAYLGAASANKFPVSENGGIALQQIANYYFGFYGSILLAIIVTIACLKTAIGLITSCSETFTELFPHSLSYKAYAIIFTIITCLIANVGLTKIITLSLPVLMFIYPLAITLIIMALISPLFKNSRTVYITTTLFTLIASIGDALNAMPQVVLNQAWVQTVLTFYQGHLPFFKIGMGWTVPALIGLCLGWILSLIIDSKNSKPKNAIIRQ